MSQVCLRPESWKRCRKQSEPRLRQPASSECQESCPFHPFLIRKWPKGRIAITPSTAEHIRSIRVPPRIKRFSDIDDDSSRHQEEPFRFLWFDGTEQALPSGSSAHLDPGPLCSTWTLRYSGVKLFYLLSLSRPTSPWSS